MCLILAIVGFVFPSTTPRRSVYGDQGQEVAWEVEQERFVEKREQEAREHEVARTVGGIGRSSERVSQHLGQAVDFEEEREHVSGQARHERFDS
jgi:hypothetical protein